MSAESQRPQRRTLRGASNVEVPREEVPTPEVVEAPELTFEVPVPASQPEVEEVEPEVETSHTLVEALPNIYEPEPLPDEDGAEDDPIQPLNVVEEKKPRASVKRPKSNKDKGEGTDKSPVSPFGKKRSYNPKRKSLAITGGVVGGIILILGFSIYRVSQAPSAEDMVRIYQAQSGDYGFPVDKGKDAAIKFLSLYLTIPEDSELRTQSKLLLDEMLIGAISPAAPTGVSQRIISGPVPAGLMNQIDAGTANQRYTAIVETTIREAQSGTDINGRPLPEKAKKSIKEVTYRVNLIVDPTGSTVLVDGNPTLLPNASIANEMKVRTPAPAPDGAFSNDINASLVEPFFKVWGASDAPAIQSWLATGASGPWTAGLEGAQTAGNITVAAPMGVKGSGSGDIRVQVEWIAPDGTRQSSDYTLGIVYENERWLISNLT